MNQKAILLYEEKGPTTTEPFLNSREMNVILSLISYAVYTQGHDPEEIRSMLEMDLGVDDIRHIPNSYYDIAVNYLLALNGPQEAVN